MSNTIIYGIIATFVVLLVTVCVLLFFIKLYRPTLKISKYFLLGFVSTFLLGLAAIQIISSYSTKEIISEEEMKYYQVSSWIAEEDSLFGTIEAKNLWSNQPTAESKFLYALALLKNGQNDKAAYLLQELGDISSRYVKTDDIVGALHDIERPIDSYVAANETVLPEAEYNEAVKKRLEDMQKRLYNDLKLTEVEAEAIIVYAPERYQYLVSRGMQGWPEEVNKFLENHIDGIQMAYVKREIAQTSMAAGLHHYSENLLVDLAQEYPTDEETILHLSELYLSGYLPSEEAATLKHVSVTTLRMDQERIEAFDEWNGSEAEITDYQNLYNEQQKFSNEIAYTLLSGVNNQSDNPIIDVRIARYYFNAGENEKAEEKMNEALEEKQNLPLDVQYTISDMNQLNTESQLASDLPQKQEQSDRLFDSLHVAGNQGSVEDTSFSVFLSNSVENYVKKDINIISVEAKTDGTVHVYVEAENINLKKNMLELLDNNEQISDFTVTKVDGSAGEIARSIGLVMDVSGSMAGTRMEASKQAVEHFVNGMDSFEQADLVAFSFDPTVVQDFTQDKGPLISKAHGFIADGGTNITDSLILEINRLKNEPGHKVLFIMTDGEDENFESQEVRSRIVSMAKQAGISIYSMGLGAGNLALQDVTNLTGGKYIGSPYESGMISGFEEISNQFEDTYKITYQLDPVEYGWHDFSLSAPEHGIAYESYQYYLDETDNEQGEAGDGDPMDDVEQTPIKDKVEEGFYVNSIYPAQVSTKEKKVEILLEGKGLKKTDVVMIDNKEITKLQKGKDNLRFDLPEQLGMGTYTITVISETGGTSSIDFDIVDPSMLTEIPFGWATLYANQISYKGDITILTGSPSIDRFMYPTASSMTLTGDELTLKGLNFKVDESKMKFIGQMAYGLFSSGKSGSNIEFTFTPKDSVGEELEVKPSQANLSQKIPGGFEIQFRDYTYQAKYGKDAGTFKAETGITGIGPYLEMFAPNLKLEKKLGKSGLFEIVGIEGKLGLEVETEKFKILGEAVFPSFGIKDVIGLEEITGKIDYDFISKRFAVDGDVGGIDILKAHTPVDGMGLTYGIEPGVGERLGARVNGSFPLGSTGAALNKVGFVVDRTSEDETSLELNVGTAFDRGFSIILDKVNKLPKIELDTENAYILAVETNFGMKNSSPKDFELFGNLKGTVLGFTFAEIKARQTRDFIDLQTSFTKLGLTFSGRSIMEFQNPRHARHLTVGFDGKIEDPTKKIVNLNMEVLVIPRDFDIDTFRIKGKLVGFDIDKDYVEMMVNTFK